MISSVSSSMASTWASELFSQLDTNNQGYIEQSDLESAFSSISGSNVNVDDVFSQLDSDSDGKVTQDEMTTAMQQVASQLDSQYNSMRMQGSQGGLGSAGGMPPPPPRPENDTGFTQDELSSQISEIGDSDSKRSSLLTDIVNNFDSADTDGNGKVTFKEAMEFEKSNQSSSTSSSSTTAASSITDSSGTSTASSTTSTDNAVMMKIMQLMHAYQIFGQPNDQSETSALSVVA